MPIDDRPLQFVALDFREGGYRVAQNIEHLGAALLDYAVHIGAQVGQQALQGDGELLISLDVGIDRPQLLLIAQVFRLSLVYERYFFSAARAKKLAGCQICSSRPLAEGSENPSSVFHSQGKQGFACLQYQIASGISLAFVSNG